MRFRVYTKAIEHADVAFVGGNGNVTFLGCGGCRKIVLRHVLFELRVD